MLFPRALSDLLEALISLRRIEDYLLADTLDDVLTLESAKLDREGWAKVSSGFSLRVIGLSLLSNPSIGLWLCRTARTSES